MCRFVDIQESEPRTPKNNEGRVSHSSIAVPIAFSETGDLVRPGDAERGLEYRCPGCGVPLVLRRGTMRRAHFAHRRGDGCSPDSQLHRAAKRRIVQVVEEWKAGRGPRPSVSRSCSRFECDGGITQDLPDDVTHATEEVRLSNGSVADVVLFRGADPAAAIEVLATHRVSQEKAERMPLPWVELAAEDVLDRPYWWVVIQDGLEPFTCPACAKRDAAWGATVGEIEGRARFVAERLNIALPPSPPYRYVPHECWRCGSRMVAYLWPGGGRHSARRPPDPIPSTVRHCVTEWAGDYWANCCPNCSSVQGDYYLEQDNADYATTSAHTQNLTQ
jgi:hypothetical protein